MEDRPGIQPTPLERVGYLGLWWMIIGLPVMIIGLRVVTDNFGMITILFLLVGPIGFIVTQLVMALVAKAGSTAWSKPAISTRTAIASLVYYGCWAVLALSADDVQGDNITNPSVQQVPSQSLISRVIGSDASRFLAIGVFFIGALALLTTFVLILVDARLKARRAGA